jgi:hypothetical protein
MESFLKEISNLRKGMVEESITTRVVMYMRVNGWLTKE